LGDVARKGRLLQCSPLQQFAKAQNETDRGSTIVCQISQVVFESHTVSGWCAIIAADQGWERAAIVGVPGPPQITDAMLIEPVHRAIDEAVGAIVFAHLAGNDRDLRCHLPNLRIPTIGAVTGVEVVEVERSDQAVVRIVWLIL